MAERFLQKRIPDRAYIDLALSMCEGMSIDSAAELLSVADESVRKWRLGEWSRIAEKTRRALHSALESAGRLPQQNTDVFIVYGNPRSVEELRTLHPRDWQNLEQIISLVLEHNAMPELLAFIASTSIRKHWPTRARHRLNDAIDTLLPDPIHPSKEK